MRGAEWAAVLAFVGFVLVGVVLAGGIADAQESDEPPESHSRATVSIGGSFGGENPPTLVIGWTTTYPARTAEEAREARNESLDISWFRGDDVLASVAAQYPNATVRYNRTRVQYQEDDGDHGEIHVRASIRIEGLFRGGRERVIVGPTLGEALSDGERLSVTTPDSWTPANATDEPGYQRHNDLIYVWVVGEDPDPLIVFNRSGVPTREPPMDLDRIFLAGYLLIAAIVLVAVGIRRLLTSDSQDTPDRTA